MAIVFDNAASSRGFAATLSFSFTIGGGTNRLMVIGVSVVDGEVGIVHYDSRPAAFAGVQVDGNLRTYLYYIWDINLPQTSGTYLLEVFGSAGLTSLEAVVVSVSGAAQGAPEVTAQSSVASSSAISTAISPVTAGAMVFDVVGTLAGGVTTLSAASGQTKRGQQDGATSDVAVSTRLFASGGPSTVGWTFNAPVTKAGHIAAAWAPAASGTTQPGAKDVRSAVLSIVTPSSTGNFAVTGVGFKGSAAFLWGVPVQGTAVAMDAAQWLGIADDASPTIRQKSVMVSSRAGVAHNRCAADRQNAISILRADSDTPVVVGAITAWTDDGFVVNFTTVAPGYVIFALVIGGADVKSYVGEAPVGAGTGSVTGLPFSPELGFAITNDATIGAAPSNISTQGFGVFDKNLNQWWVGSFHGIEDTSKKNSLLKTSGFAGQLSRSGSPAASAVIWEAHLTSISAGGFAWTGSDNDGFFFLALNLNGSRAKVGSISKSTAAAPVVQSLPDPGFQIQSYLLATAGKNDQNPATALGTSVALGAFAGSRQRSTLRTDPDAATNADQRVNDQRVLGLGDTDASYTALARALPITSQTPGLEWSPNDAQARLIGYLMLERGVVDPVQLETPVTLVSAGSLAAGTPTARTVDESVVLQLRDTLNLSDYRLEHLANPALGKAGGWQLYYQFNEGVVLGTGSVLEVHSSSAEVDLEPRPGRAHRYVAASGQPGQFLLNVVGDLVRLVRPDGVESQELPVAIASDPGPTGRIVRGDVLNTAGALVPGVLVEALQLSWTSLGLQESSLGKVLTNTSGHYEIRYTPTVGGSTDCGPPPGEVSLLVRALAGDLTQAGAELSRSAVVAPAREVEELSLTVDRPALPSRAEYAIVDAQFRKCLSQQASDLFQVWLGVRDKPGYLAFAARATSLDSAALLAYAQANLIARDINQAIPFGGTDPRFAEFGPIAAEVVYALTRGGRGTQLSEVLRLEPQQFLTTLVSAMDRGQIDRVYQTRLAFDAAQSLAKQWSTIRAFFFGDDAASLVVKTNEAKLLALVLTDATKRQTVAARQSEFRGSFEDFVASLKADATLTAAQAEDLLFVFELYALVGHLPIVQIVYAQKATRGWKTVDELSTVTRRAENGIDGWTEYAMLQVGNGGFPEDIFGRTFEEKAASHARRLFETFSKEFSQTRFVEAAATHANSSSDPTLQAAVTFIKANSAFNLVETPLARYLKQNALTLPEPTTQKVLELQRLRRLTPDFSAATALSNAGLGSAVSIARLDEDAFIADHEQALGGLLKAQTIFRKAKQILAEVANLVVRFHEQLNDTGGSPAMLGTLSVSSTLQEHPSDTSRFAQYATLFGNLFSCATRQCETVLSPAAYLVDLLQYITDAPRATLLSRRPDLAELDLGCDNTDRSLPYIDLVIERLSALVADWRVTLTGITVTQLDGASATPPSSTHLAAVLNAIKAGGTTGVEAFHFTARARLHKPRANEWMVEDDAVRWRITPQGGTFVAVGTPQTSAQAEQLDVFPEHDNPLAERKLSEAVFPFQLPLELGRRELELILKQRGVSRAEVLAAFPSGLATNAELPDALALVANASHARAFLSLTVAEETAILSQALAAHQYWGFAGTATESIPRPDTPLLTLTGSWRELLTEVAVFLHRSQLTYAQTLDLLQTEFIQSTTQPIVILADAEEEVECNYNRYHLVQATGGGQTAPLSEASLRRISFFLRLWQKLGWSMNTLDRYLVLPERLDPPQARTTPANLLRLARFVQVSQLLSLDPVDLLVFYAPLDVRKRERLGPSPFERAVLQGQRSSVGFQILEGLATAQSVEIGSQEALESAQANLRASLGIGRADLLRIWDEVGVGVSELSLTQLSAVVRTATFVRAVGISADDYYLAIETLDLAPFGSGDLDAALDATAKAVSELRALAGSKLSLATVSYLLRHRDSQPSLPPTTDQVDAVRRQLTTAARAIEQRYPAVVGADVTTLATFLAEVMPSEQVPRVVAELTKPTASAPALLARYFEGFVGAGTAALVSAIVTPDPDDQDDEIRRLARVVQLVAVPLRAFLLARERRQQALTLAADTFALPRPTADFLLQRALTSTTLADQPAIVDWESALGAFGADFEALSGNFQSRWVAATDARVRFVAFVSTAQPPSSVTLTLNGEVIAQEGASVEIGELTQLTFAPVDVRAGEVRAFAFSAPGATTRLAVRLDNADAGTLPLGWFTSFELASFVKLQKAALLVDGASLNPVELLRLRTEDLAAASDARLLDGFPLVEGASVPWSRLRGFLDRLALHRRLRLENTTLFEVLAGTETLDADTLADLGGWGSGEDVSAVLTQVWTSAPPFTDTRVWASLERAFGVAAKLDLGARQVLSLLVADVPLAPVARTLRDGLRAQYSATAFAAAFKAPRDELRRAHRDALVGYLTSRYVPVGGANRFFINDNDLFGFFLIDVEMEPDTQISRLKLALSSVQLFIQRIFLGLEGVQPFASNETKREQWKWMQSYRVWEANRKVFLFPENWIEPQLRDDKSELFRELEGELLQDDVDDERAEEVLASYVDKLRELSQLLVVGMHTWGSTVYYVARTRSKPYVYYYRTSVRDRVGGTFTPWKKIPIEIDSEFVAPVQVGGSVRIVWPLIVEKEQVSSDEAGLGATAIIRLLWSTLDQATDKWSKPRIGKARLLDALTRADIVRDGNHDTIDTRGYHLSPAPQADGGVVVSVYKTGNPPQVPELLDLQPRFLGNIIITHQGEDFAQQYGTVASLGGFYPAVTILRNGAAYELDSNAPFDQLWMAGNRYFGRVPTAQSFRLVMTDAAYFVDPNLGTFVFEAGGAHLMGDIDYSYALPGLSGGLVREALFETFDHPVMGEIAQRFRADGAPAIMNRLTQALPTSKSRSVYTYHPVGGNAYRPATVYGQTYTYYGGVYLGYYIAGDSMAFGITQRDFQLDYAPDKLTVRRTYPLPTVEFAHGTPYGTYNWELFFHLPMLVADRLAQQLRFEDALKWLHYVFDPKNDLNPYERTKAWAQDLPLGARYWNFLPFFANKDVNDSLLDVFGVTTDNANPKRDEELRRIVSAWRNDPFNPHLIARQRIAAYQKFTVMKYLDTLIAWGDELFRQDTFESINQATQLYVLASELLGDKPEVIESLEQKERASYRDLTATGIDAFSNALMELESLAVGGSLLASDDGAPEPHPDTEGTSAIAFSTLFFRVPRNERLEGYWDTVADRLFKIRNSLNIDGVKRQLALFEPPIDPALLVKLKDQPIDLSSALSQLNRALPHYRFNTWVAQAKELAGELKSFSAALLAALEKKDAEALARLRQDHELRLLAKVSDVRKAQLRDAEQNLTALQERRNMPLDRIADLSSRKFISPSESSNMFLTAQAGSYDATAGVMNTIAGVLGVIPQLTVGFLSADAEFGGQHLSSIYQAFGNALGVSATVTRTDAALAGMLSSFERRKEDWDLQLRQAKLELKDLDAQIVGTQIRIDIARKELENHELQREQSQQVQDFFSDKFSNQELYQLMITQLTTAYQQAYRLAHDVAKTAERAFAFELGLPSADFVQFDYRESQIRGLLAGEKLYLDLKRMEVAYLEQNQRELEITKAISLESINPAALQELRQKGSCEFALPEVLFDLDFPGQYFRRIRAVRLTIPAVTGPYTSVSAKLSLLGSATRVKSAADPDSYAYTGLDDPRFVHDVRGIQSIATSRAQDDAGVFELNFKDERYLPFEGAGVVSRWRLELPEVARQFDYSSISDVVMQLSYTARDAGGSLKQGANAQIATALNGLRHLISEASSDTGLSRVLSLKREFPDALHQLLTSHTTTLELRPEHFPYVLRQLGLSLRPADAQGNVEVLVQTKTALSGASLSLALNEEAPAAASLTATDGYVVGSVVRGTSNLLVGGSERWTLTSSNLSLASVEDVIFDLRYVVQS